jgi:tetratricopeptide (TPR) repeat protein
MPWMTASFRPSLVNLSSHFKFLTWLVPVMGLASCSQWAKSAPEPPPEPVAPVVAQGPSLDELQTMVSTPGADLNAVLNAMERARPSFQLDPAYWLLFGGTSLSFAQKQTDLGQTSALEVMYNDAEFAYQKALELSPNSIDGLWGLIFSRRMLGNFEGAWQASLTALSLPSDLEIPARLPEEIGRAGLALVIESVNAGLPLPAAAGPAEGQFRLAWQAGREPALIGLSDLMAWQGRQPEAIEVLIDGLSKNPGMQAAADRLKNLAHGKELVGAWDRIGRRFPENALVQWRLGESLWNLYWNQRQKGEYSAAHETLNRAEDSFLNAMAVETSYRSSCQDWLHLVRTGHGWLYWLESRVDDAASAFLAALEADPDRLEDQADAETLRLGIYSVEGYYFQNDRLDKVRTFHARLFKTYQDNPDWTNNYAFACRDLAVQRAQQGKAEQARLIFEESWRAYTRTVELAPTDARLINDRALIAVYYLEDHWEEAEQELHRAIQLGTSQLAEMAQDVPERERQNLDEAVGDAWENLAYLDVMRRQRLDRATEFLAQAVQHYPFENRRGVLSIRAEIDKLNTENPDH